jgi:hypothetical protein
VVEGARHGGDGLGFRRATGRDHSADSAHRVDCRNGG